MAENKSHYCMAVGPHVAQRNTRAAAVRSLLWKNGQTITVRFLGGGEQLRARVRSVVAEWTDIRISFVTSNDSWSTIGTVASQVDQTEPTLNYGWLTDDSPDDTLRRVVLHEFGHTVGLIHEHQNPQHAIEWNRDAVIADLSRPPASTTRCRCRTTS